MLLLVMDDAIGNALLQLAQVGVTPLLLVAEQVGLEQPRGPKSCTSHTHRDRVCPVTCSRSWRSDIQGLPSHWGLPWSCQSHPGVSAQAWITILPSSWLNTALSPQLG